MHKIHLCNVYKLKDIFSTEQFEMDEIPVVHTLIPYVIMYNVLFKAVVVLVKF